MSLTSSVSGCVFLPAPASLGVGIHSALLFWERSTLGQVSKELIVHIVFAFQCGRSVPGERSLRKALSPVFPSASAEIERRLKSWGSQMDLTEDWRWARPFLLLPLPDLALTLWGWRHVLKRFPPPRERARRLRELPLRRRVVRASIKTKLWIIHHSLSCLRSCWRWWLELWLD